MNTRIGPKAFFLTAVTFFSVFIPDKANTIQYSQLIQPEDIHLKVRECTVVAEGTQLGCNREGFFIHSFSGSYHGAGDHQIPHSDVTCCRPEIPEIEKQDAEDATPVGIVSVGCHIAVSDPDGNMACEHRSNSLISGFVDSFNAHQYPLRLVPVKGVLCCSPMLLMSSGDVWELEPCNCGEESLHKDGSLVNCSPGKLLSGFANSAVYQKHDVPVSPVKCCDLCLGEFLHKKSSCEHLDACKEKGVCLMGRCQCFPNWVGEDCSQPSEEYFAPRELESSVWWLGGIGFLGAFFCLFATFWVIRRAEQEGLGQGNDRGLLGLINSYMNDNGSVGSSDTQATDGEEGDTNRRQGTQETSAENNGDELKGGCVNGNEAYKPLLQMTCFLCEARPVEATLVPCGHSNLCRRCSRRLTTCPFCRKTIVRRQRLYLSV